VVQAHDLNLTLDAEVGAEQLEVGEERQQVRQNHHGIVERSGEPHQVSALLEAVDGEAQLALHERLPLPIFGGRVLAAVRHERLNNSPAVDDVELKRRMLAELTPEGPLHVGDEIVEASSSDVTEHHMQTLVLVLHGEALSTGGHGHAHHTSNVALLDPELARPTWCASHVQHLSASNLEAAASSQHGQMVVEVLVIGADRSARPSLPSLPRSPIATPTQPSIAVPQIEHPLELLRLPAVPLQRCERLVAVVPFLHLLVELLLDERLIGDLRRITRLLALPRAERKRRTGPVGKICDGGVLSTTL